MKLTSSTFTHTGSQRPNNADRLYANDISGIYLISDGIGNDSDSSKASETIVEQCVGATIEWLASDQSRDEASLRRRLFEMANAIADSREISGSATLTGLVFLDEQLFHFNVGDSPAYLLRPNQVLMTSFHTILDERKSISDFSALKSMVGSNILSNSLGKLPFRFLNVEKKPVNSGDMFGLFSDGLFEFIDQSKLFSLASTGSPMKEIAKAIIETGQTTVTPDNYSGILITVS